MEKSLFILERVKKRKYYLNMIFDFPKINTLFINIHYSSVSVHNQTAVHVDGTHVNNV